jgi:hypothetical protein
MNVNLASYTVTLSKDYLLEFEVVDPYEIEARLLAARDETKVDTNLVVISTNSFIRESEVDEETGDLVDESLEQENDFAFRAWNAAKAWAYGEIASHQDAIKVHNALRRVLDRQGLSG